MDEFYDPVLAGTTDRDEVLSVHGSENSDDDDEDVDFEALSSSVDSNRRVFRHHRLLKRAILVNTWLLFSIAVAHQRITPAFADPADSDSTFAGRIPSLSNDGVVLDHQLEISDDDHDEVDQDESEALIAAASGIGSKGDSSGSVRQQEGVIVVSSVDGSLAGISRATGKVLWKRLPETPGQDAKGTAASGSSSTAVSQILSPMVSTTTTTTKASGSEWRTTAVPSVDGRVYLTAPGMLGGAGTTSSGDGSVTAATTVKELVDRAPFVDARGRFYVGNRRSTAAAIDRDTGEILRVVSGHPDQQQQDEEGLEVSSLEGHNVVWIGRVDYSVSLFDARSGVMDVQFSSSEVMSVHDMAIGEDEVNDEVVDGDYDDDDDTGTNNKNSNDPTGLVSLDGIEATQHAPRLMFPSNSGRRNSRHHSSTSSAKNQSVLMATPQGNVAYRNPGTQKVEWISSETFDAPIAFAVDSDSGLSIGVDIVPLENESDDLLGKDIDEQKKVMERIGDNFLSSSSSTSEQTVVGALKTGELFAMPLGKRVDQHHQGASGGLSRSSSTASSSRLAIGSSRTTMSQVPSIGGGRNRQGFYSQHHQQQPHPHFHNSYSSRTTALSKHHHECYPSSRDYPACLVGSVQEIGSRESENLSFLDTADTQSLYNALAMQYQREMGLLPPDYNLILGQNRIYQRNNKKKQLSRLMSSWLPPTMALIFVLAFEFGRRHRQQRKEASNAKLKESDDKENLDDSSKRDGGIRSVGAIQVTEDVLGFGGHGTVVFKGMLDKRQVAVKRMLRAYHASADREISLLIESDGHPNVVRYFMKEVRGDFVYLALELCDLSLHDLIAKLRNQQIMVLSSENGTGSVTGTSSQAVKTALYQIASGVKHLHSLRIVHRDLKPANILMALTGRQRPPSSRIDSNGVELSEPDGTVARFEEGLYVAKISDMGLGKQLAGQSSFGLSTLGNASLHGASNNGREGSNVVGAGPGSVGWQAPEVMAVRWPADGGSVRSDASSKPEGGGSNLMDGSPLDVTNRTSRSVDIFSLGCIFHCTLIPGQHPFGEWFEREANIMRNKPNLERLADLSTDAHDLVSSMLSRDPKGRPTAKQVCDHPFFWSATKRLAFLCDLSDRIESDAQVAQDTNEVSSTFCSRPYVIESDAANVVGTAWDSRLDSELINNVARFRTYDPSSIRDCLRLIRNKHHHFDELPVSLKESMGNSTEGLMTYFDERFPPLLMHCYRVCREYMSLDDSIMKKFFAHYTRSNSITTKLPIAQVSSISAVSNPVIPEIQVEPPEEGPESSVVDVVGDEVEEKQEEVSLEPSLDDSFVEVEVQSAEEEVSPPATKEDSKDTENEIPTAEAPSIVLWHGSTAAKSFNCRGWLRADDEWERRPNPARRRDPNLARCLEEPKFRTRLCNHWDASNGTFCPMRKKGKCIFAHGPVELRVKEGKRNRWGKLVDKEGNNSNPCNSGGEDTYGAARSIETQRKEEGKWNTRKGSSSKNGIRSSKGRPNHTKRTSAS